MTKTQKELKEEFYNKFTCLVKPVAYTFTKGGKKREVEGSCEVRDSVWSWIEKALPQKRRNKMNKTKKEWKEEWRELERDFRFAFSPPLIDLCNKDKPTLADINEILIRQLKYIEKALQEAREEGWQTGHKQTKEDYQAKEEKVRQKTLKEIYCMVIKNGSANRGWMLSKLTELYSKISGVNVPKTK